MASPSDGFWVKTWTYLQSLNWIEVGGGIIAVGLPAIGAAWFLWKLASKRAHTEGRTYEVLHGQVPGLRQQISTLSDQVDRRNEQIATLKTTQDLTSGRATELPPDVKAVLRLKDAVSADDAEPWRLRGAKPLAHLRERLLASTCKIITIGNLKGGVGKTTLTANLAAYFAIALSKRVLIIDLDYQGSVTATILRAAGKEIEFSQIDQILSGLSTGRSTIERAVDLSPMLPQAKLVPAGYTLQVVEDQLMLRWLFQTTDKDVRFNLAEVLLSEEIQRRFDVVLLDMGPRLTTASLSALCASTHLVVPTNLDKLSVETVAGFLRQVRRIKDEFRLAIELVGVVGTMTTKDELNAAENEAQASIVRSLEVWPSPSTVLKRTIPRTTALSNIAGTSIGYLSQGQPGVKIKVLFNSLGQEVATRIGLK